MVKLLLSYNDQQIGEQWISFYEMMAEKAAEVMKRL